jgi:hypothetical protein
LSLQGHLKPGKKWLYHWNDAFNHFPMQNYPEKVVSYALLWWKLMKLSNYQRFWSYFKMATVKTPWDNIWQWEHLKYGN